MGMKIKILTLKLQNNLIIVMKSYKEEKEYFLPQTYHLEVTIHLCPE